MARFATKRDRVAVWTMQDGKCGGCGRDLSDGFEIDHHTPWAERQDGNLWNLQALCVSCHRLKTSSDCSRLVSRSRRRSGKTG
jgi:5-methylcytosine-specific restriction endonuclease McrA